MIDKPRFMYEIGDLVELARFGFSPKEARDKVYGLVVGVIDPIDYFVPRYKVRISYQPESGIPYLDDFVVSRNEKVITVMEYDIVERGAAGEREGAQD
jgi:hypothetical protein